MLRKDTEEWTVNTDPLQLPYWAENRASQLSYFDAGGSKSSRIERTFDTYHNVTQQVTRGDTSVTTDDRTLTSLFVPNATKYIVDRVAYEWESSPSLTQQLHRA